MEDVKRRRFCFGAQRFTVKGLGFRDLKLGLGCRASARVSNVHLNETGMMNWYLVKPRFKVPLLLQVV